MEKEKAIENTINEIFGFIGIDPDYYIDKQDENIYNVRIEGDDLNYLIGYRGQSLDALQTLLGLILQRKTSDWTTIIVDINDYKTRHADRIHGIAKRFIDKVRFFNDEAMLPPMNPWERRQVHVFISEYDDVESESTGEGKSRRVVLKPKKKK